MKAVNLIPEDARRGGGNAVGRSGGAAYGVIGVLVVLVMVVSAYAFTSKQISDRQDQVTQLRAQQQAAQARAASLAAYKDFRTMSQARVQTVRGLMGGRFDWAHALREVSRVVPASAWMTSVTATVAPGVAVQGSTGGGDTGRDAVQAPAIEIVGCVPDNAQVATLMARLRTIDGVDSVALGAAQKNDTATAAGPATAGAASQGDCRQGSDKIPQFSLVVFYKPQPGLLLPTAAAASAAAAAPATANQKAATSAVGATSSPAGGSK